jgi:hypothetical protein
MKSPAHFRLLLVGLLAVMLLSACAAGQLSTPPSPDETGDCELECLNESSLESLKSYRLKLHQTTRWEMDGQPFEETRIILQSATHSPVEMMHIKQFLYTAETGIIPVSTDQYRMGSQTFSSESRDGREVCRVFDLHTSPLREQGIFDPAVFFIDSIQKLEKRADVVNDVVTNRFQVSGLRLPLEDIEQESATLWVAQNGGYIVRFVASARGQQLLDGEKIAVSVDWEFDLTDVNQKFEIILSPDCQQQKAMFDSLPIPPSAVEVELMDNFLTFSTPDSSESTADFIRQGMQADQWINIFDHVDETEGMYMLQFLKGTDIVDVLVSRPREGGSYVTFSQRPQ